MDNYRSESLNEILNAHEGELKRHAEQSERNERRLAAVLFVAIVGLVLCHVFGVI